SANGNPLDLTLYEIALSTGASYPNGLPGNITLSTRPAGSPTATFTGLVPATTYFAFARAINHNGVATEFAVLGSTRTRPYMAPITDLSATSGPGFREITLQWTAPSYLGDALPLNYVIRASSASNIDTQAQFDAALALSAFSTATIPSVAASGTVQTLVVTGLDPCTVHYFAIEAVDGSTPATRGGWLRSVPLGINANNSAASQCPRPPMMPLGLTFQSTGATTAILAWNAVDRFYDGVLFTSTLAPTAQEVSGYQILRATSAANASWTAIASVSTATLSWQDSASGPQYFYRIRAFNSTGYSRYSMARAQATRNLWVVAYDDMSTLEIPNSYSYALANYHIDTASRTQELRGRVIKSMELLPLRWGDTPASVELEGPAVLKMRFERNAQGLVASAHVPLAKPEDLSVFWYNGSKWLQLYGQLDASNQVLSVQTKYLGPYQLRAAERVGSFVFNPAGLTNRMLTPNGDGKNDTVVFTFDNPRFSEVTGKIFDVKGAFVASMYHDPTLDSNTTLVWDGKSNGAVVPGGVYIYQIEAEGRNYTGTVVVVK
ncbi:MAG: gliding motility-associated C-terminal domain-containing protein, partial [Elusimicrobia bacterium]|nr:gliding motility-associated C-terminal domain-containing protein [Elusimicrobiota bacterium]